MPYENFRTRKFAKTLIENLSDEQIILAARCAIHNEWDNLAKRDRGNHFFLKGSTLAVYLYKFALLLCKNHQKTFFIFVKTSLPLVCQQKIRTIRVKTSGILQEQLDFNSETKARLDSPPETWPITSGSVLPNYVTTAIMQRYPTYLEQPEQTEPLLFPLKLNVTTFYLPAHGTTPTNTRSSSNRKAKEKDLLLDNEKQPGCLAGLCPCCGRR